VPGELRAACVALVHGPDPSRQESESHRVVDSKALEQAPDAPPSDPVSQPSTRAKQGSRQLHAGLLVVPPAWPPSALDIDVPDGSNGPSSARLGLEHLRLPRLANGGFSARRRACSASRRR